MSPDSKNFDTSQACSEQITKDESPSQLASDEKIRIANIDSGSRTQIAEQNSTDQSDAESIGGQRNSDLPRKRLLISITALSLINGRLSDIFGRKNMLLLCLFLMGVGDLACGFAKTPVQFDITSLQNRGYYQAIIWFYLPLKHRSGGYMEKIKKIDYGGIVLNIASTLLLLIPISGGGVTYAWTSAFFIATVIISILLAVLFVLFEWKLAKLPIMPLRLYRAPHCWALYLQSFLTGLAYFGNFFYLPLYFQSVLGYDALVAGALILAVVIPTSLTSILSGQYMSRVGSYMHCILAGFALWTLGNGLTLIFDRETKLGPLIAILIVEGAGIGFTLQPTLVGMYANGRSEDRAVTTGLRNFIRTIGGAFGVVISGVILSNTLNKELGGKGIVSNDTIAQLTSSTYSLSSMGLSQQDQDIILDAYMKGLYYTFVFFTELLVMEGKRTDWRRLETLFIDRAPDAKRDEEEERY
uniref:Major facilitator superfamily (MFS) profile domain-containing protein n=1 Tax=Fusarium oxysporum (strain Fo5176) TaxID=660025 RepID=A0A0D2Y664_FUSOF